jgi:hypothetical protein
MSSITHPAERPTSWTARASAAARALAAHERSLAFLCALTAAALAFEPRIRGGGFAADDWAEYAKVKFPTALGFHSSLAALASNAGSRIGASLYWLASFSVFGGHTRFYSALAASLAVLMAFSIYVLLRELHFSIAQSLAIMILTIVTPTVETVRFWFTPSGSQLSLALYFFGLTLALRAFSTTGRAQLRLHAGSWALYVLSASYAEVALPFMGVGILAYLTRAPLARCLRRWGFDLLVVVGGYLATFVFVSSDAGFVKLPRSQWGEHAHLIADQALTIVTRALDPFVETSRQPVLVGIAVLAAAGLLLYRGSHTSPASRQMLLRCAVTVLVSVLAIALALAVYVPAILYYEPLGPGLPSHIDIVIAAPLAAGSFAVFMCARVVIAELLDRVRPGAGRVATLVLLAWFAVIAVDGLRDVRNDGRIWASADDRDDHILKVLTADLPRPVGGSTTYTFGEAGTAAPGLPLFFSAFELTNAVKLAYGRGDISAYPVVKQDDTVHCAPKGITVASGSTVLNSPSAYGRSYFFDLPTGSYQRIDSPTACTAALLSKFHPGPYSTPIPLRWSQ